VAATIRKSIRIAAAAAAVAAGGLALLLWRFCCFGCFGRGAPTIRYLIPVSFRSTCKLSNARYTPQISTLVTTYPDPDSHLDIYPDMNPWSSSKADISATTSPMTKQATDMQRA
jgi:hypothetical protein